MKELRYPAETQNGGNYGTTLGQAEATKQAVKDLGGYRIQTHWRFELLPCRNKLDDKVHKQHYDSEALAQLCVSSEEAPTLHL
jgi:hypothetical protein